MENMTKGEYQRLIALVLRVREQDEDGDDEELDRACGVVLDFARQSHDVSAIDDDGYTPAVGREAEELRAQIETVCEDTDVKDAYEVRTALRRILDEVDARDSVRHLAENMKGAAADALALVSRYAPCGHGSYDDNLGSGGIWGKCVDCGETFALERGPKYLAAAEAFEAAVGTLATALALPPPRLAEASPTAKAILTGQRFVARRFDFKTGPEEEEGAWGVWDTGLPTPGWVVVHPDGYRFTRGSKAEAEVRAHGLSKLAAEERSQGVVVIRNGPRFESPTVRVGGEPAVRVTDDGPGFGDPLVRVGGAPPAPELGMRVRFTYPDHEPLVTFRAIVSVVDDRPPGKLGAWNPVVGWAELLEVADERGVVIWRRS